MAQQTFSGVPGDFTAGQVLTAADMDKLREFLLYLIKDGDEGDTGEVSPLILDLNDNRVGINTDAPGYPLEINRTDGNYENVRIVNTAAGALYRSTDSVATTEMGTQAGSAVIRTANTIRLTVTAAGLVALGGAIALSGETAAANQLDDYEEGTWTPGIKFSTTAATVSVTHATYTKIGRMVHCMITALRPTNFNGGTGNISLTGLPFTSAASYYYGTVQGSPLSMAAGESFIQVYVEAGTTCRLLVQSTTAHADITDGDCATTTKFYGSFTYFV